MLLNKSAVIFFFFCFAWLKSSTYVSDNDLTVSDVRNNYGGRKKNEFSPSLFGQRVHRSYADAILQLYKERYFTSLMRTWSVCKRVSDSFIGKSGWHFLDLLYVRHRELLFCPTSVQREILWSFSDNKVSPFL